MSLLLELKSKQLNARVKRDDLASSLYTYILGRLTNVSKNPTDDMVINECKAFIKSVSEMVYSDASMEIKKQREIELLKELLPSTLSHDEIQAVVNTLDKNLSVIMKHFKANFNGRYDSLTVKAIAESYINS